METNLRKFKSNDIGGELLPVITKGLYRDHRDAIREYIQNAIDANASQVRIIILGSTIIIEDNGDGMTREIAEKSIRIGLSDKNPDQQVGFRGVGLYSSYDLSSSLQIISIPKDGSIPSKISFRWDAIKGKLLNERELRLKGEPSRLSLEELLFDCIEVTNTDATLTNPHGTKVIIAGVDPILMKSFSDKSHIISYLQDAVSLNFSPEFKHGAVINEWLDEAGIRTIRVFFKIDEEETEVSRPYLNSLFTRESPTAPIKIDLIDKSSQKSHGFAWVCFNGANAYIPNYSIRGILIKKMGFSVGMRQKLEPLFTRVVFSRRSTGEVIILNNELLPNAARTDFEPGPEKDSFGRALSNLVIEVSRNGNKWQNIFKCYEVMEGSLKRLTDIDRKISEGKISASDLAQYHSNIETILDDLKKIKRIAIEADEEKYNEIIIRLKNLKSAVTQLTTEAKKKAVDIVQEQIKAAQERTSQEEILIEPPQKTIVEIAKAAGPQSVEEMLVWIELIDNEIKELLDPSDYEYLVELFTDLLEGISNR